MLKSRTIGLDHLVLNVPAPRHTLGAAVLEGVFQLASRALAQLQRELDSRGHARGAVISRVRGTGPGVSFGRLIEVLEHDHPIKLRSPFEESDLVAGGVWSGAELVEASNDQALLKLRFEQGAIDLPLHTHECSDRFIMVLEGRGYFHVCDEPAELFSPDNVRTIPVRSRDVLMFTRGTVHTFSAPHEPLVLLSFHAPFIGLEDPDQYAVPGRLVRPRELLERDPHACVACDPAWSLMACWPGL